MRVYIRHGNRVSEANDSPVTPESLAAIPYQVKELLKYVPPPQYIIVSPYLRCRQTAYAINQSLPRPVKIVVDVNVSSKSGALRRAFSCPGENCAGMLDLHTFKYGPPINEPRNVVYQRISKHLDNTQQSPNIWVVAHKGCIADILTLNGHQPVYVRPLQGLVIDDNCQIQMFDTGIF